VILYLIRIEMLVLVALPTSSLVELIFNSYTVPDKNRNAGSIVALPTSPLVELIFNSDTVPDKNRYAGSSCCTHFFTGRTYF
jgi:hypothetical protein